MTAAYSSAPYPSASMDVKHEMIYRDDDVLLVKTEPQPHPAAGAAAAASLPGMLTAPGNFAGFAKLDEWMGSPSPGAVGASAPPLTPSPGPPSQPYTVISNGYSSPMSSGSYDPYSPNGKIGKCSCV